MTAHPRVRPRLLDLFCGAGGASWGYWLAGFDVVGVDIEPQPRYPFPFHRADALTFPLAGFDVVHASPPCQAYSSKTRVPGRHPRLIGVVRERLRGAGVPYVIENVERARGDMVAPVRLCGSQFGLGVRRHRLFETSFRCPPGACRHGSQPPRYRVYDHGKWYLSRTVPVWGEGGGRAAEHWADAMGIQWMDRAELAEAIPPAYTKWIGERLMSK